jgi:hypothetical protein
MASWGLLASRIATLTLHSTHRGIVKNLQPDSEMLEIIRASFATFLKEDKVKVYSFIEERGISHIPGLSGKVRKIPCISPAVSFQKLT